jgi:hypothetical protein
MPGPLPEKTRRRRNAPTIPTTNLPAEGFAGPYPKVPKWVTLGPDGSAWWRWAWRTPQAAAWSAGVVDFVATRASLVDDLVTLDRADDGSLADIASSDELAVLIRRLLSMATGRLSIEKHMADMDKALGLTPKGFADLRWEIVASPAESTTEADTTGRSKDRRTRLTVAS